MLVSAFIQINCCPNMAAVNKRIVVDENQED
jgi:hypothetical protein